MSISRSDIEAAVGEAVLHYARTDKPISPSTRFADLKFDSLSIVEVVMMVDDILGVELDDDVCGSWGPGTTIRQAVESIVDELCGEEAA